MGRAGRRRKQSEPAVSPVVRPPHPGLWASTAPILAFLVVQVSVLLVFVWLARGYSGRIDNLWPRDAQVVLLVIPQGLPPPEQVPALQALAKGRSIAYLALAREQVPDHKLEWFETKGFPPGPILTPGLGLGDGSLGGMLGAVGLERLAATPWIVLPAELDEKPFVQAGLKILRLGKQQPADAPERNIFGAADWNGVRGLIESGRASG